MRPSLVDRLRERGVFRVAISYAVIAWLVLQIASVVFEPLGLPRTAMRVLIVVAAAGFPVALVLAWFLEITPRGVVVDRQPSGVDRPRLGGARRYADVVVIAVLLVVIAALLARGEARQDERRSIAVLPFTNTSLIPDQDYFSDGIAEEFITQLSRVPGLRVAARGSSFTVRDRVVDHRAVAARLGVATLLAGSVSRVAGRLELRAELVDGRSGQRLWSAHYERASTELFALQQEVLQQVVAQLLPGGTPLQVYRPPTSNAGAYDLYLLGRAAQVRRTLPNLEKSVDLFEQAIAGDPGYALAYTGLANSLLLIRGWRVAEGEEAARASILARAEAAVHRALEIDPQLSEAHGALANLMRRTHTGDAEAEYRRAIELNPNNALALHDLAGSLGERGERFAEAAQLEERALAIDPLHVASNGNLFTLWFALGERGKYEAAADLALARLADDAAGLERISDWFISLGDPLRGMRAAQRWMRISPAGQPRLAAVSAAGVYCVLEDLANCERLLDFAAQGPRAPEIGQITAWYRIDAAGLRGDLDGLHALVDDPAYPLCSLTGASDPVHDRHAILAFWEAVEGRFVEAAADLDAAGPVEEREWEGPFGCNTASYGPVAVWTYLHTGRAAQAGPLATKLRSMWQAELERDPRSPAPIGSLALLDAVQGKPREATQRLREALGYMPYPDAFQPARLWQALMRDAPDYPTLVAEKERRRGAILAQIAADQQAAR